MIANQLFNSPPIHTYTHIIHGHAHISTDQSTQVLSANIAATVVYNATTIKTLENPMSALKMTLLMNQKFHQRECLSSL